MNTSRIAHRATRIAPLAVLITLPLVLLAPLVLGGRVLYWGVPLMQFYPWQRFAVETWRLGEVPLWNPLVGNGAPLAANLQTGVFYPLNALHFVLPTEYAMSYTAALHVALAGLFMFAFLRAIGLRPFPSLIGAAAFQLSGFLIARLAFLSITMTLPWVAAWLWRAERVTQSGRLRDGAWLAVVVGLGLLAGHAQTALYGLFLLTGYVIYRAIGLVYRSGSSPAVMSHGDTEHTETNSVLSVPQWLEEPKAQRTGTPTSAFSSALRRMALFGGGTLLGAGLAAVQLLPAAELARESQRAGGLDYAFAMTHSYWPWRLLTIPMPDLFGNPADGTFWGYDNYWENAAYIGVLPLGLSAAAILSWWRERRMKHEGGRRKVEEAPPVASSFIPHPSSFQTPFFAGATLLSLVLAFGWFTPIYPFLFRTVPGLGLFQGPARWLSVFTLALCALAAIGAESALRRPGDFRRSARWIVVGVALIGAGVVARAFLAGRTATFPDATLRLGVLVAAGGLLCGLRPPSGDRRFRLWSSAVVAFVALDLLTAGAALNPTIAPAAYRAPSPVARAVKAAGEGRVFLFDDDDSAIRNRFGIRVPFADFGPQGVEAWLGFRDSLIANVSMIDGLRSANNFDSLLIGRYVEVIDAVNAAPLDAALRLLSLMHVGFVSSARELDRPVVARGAETTVYRNEGALPRAWIVPSARVEADAVSAMLDPAFDPRREVILELGERASAPSSGAGRFALQFLRDTPNTVTIRAASEQEGYLILADTWYPGWQASIDGTPASVLRANAAFRTVAFPAGEHTVEFRYEPDSFRIGAGMTAASALVTAAAWIVSSRRRRQS